MTQQEWVVVLRDQETRGKWRDPYVYGPMPENVAKHLADWFTKLVDPAVAVPLKDGIMAALSFADDAHRLRAAAKSMAEPEHWPPQPGDIWRDRCGRNWSCQHPAAFGSWAAKAPYPYLVCLAEPGDDPAEEINRVFGPLTLAYRPDPRDEEPPF